MCGPIRKIYLPVNNPGNKAVYASMQVQEQTEIDWNNTDFFCTYFGRTQFNRYPKFHWYIACYVKRSTHNCLHNK